MSSGCNYQRLKRRSYIASSAKLGLYLLLTGLGFPTGRCQDEMNFTQSFYSLAKLFLDLNFLEQFIKHFIFIYFYVSLDLNIFSLVHNQAKAHDRPSINLRRRWKQRVKKKIKHKFWILSCLGYNLATNLARSINKQVTSVKACMHDLSKQVTKVKKSCG